MTARLRGVKALGAAVALAAAALWPLAAASPPVDRPFRLPFLALLLACAAVELAVVRFDFREEAHAFSLAEVALVIGFAAADPLPLLAARLLGSAIAFAAFRLPWPKRAFNLVLLALELAVGWLAYGAVLGGAAPTSPRGWLAALVACAAADATSHATVVAAIALSTGRRPSWAALRPLLQVSAAVLVLNTCLGLLCVVVADADPRSTALLGVTGAGAWGGYRAYTALRQRLERTRLLYRFTRALNDGDPDAVAATVARTAAELLQARGAAVALVEGGGAHLLAATGDEPPDLERLAAWAAGDGPARALGPARRLGRHGVAMAAPAATDAGTLVLWVGARDSQREGWGPADLQVFEALAGHTAMALRTSRLLQRLRDELDAKHHAATHDGLTGLANRARLFEVLDAAIASGGPATVLAIDLDGFKQVNDTLGHEVGDELLRVAADRLSGVAGAVGGLASRIGGDEFAVHLAVGPVEALAAAARLQEALTAPLVLRGYAVDLGASVGVAAGEPGAAPAELLRRADVAMYLAKRRRGGIELYDAANDHTSSDRIVLAAELRQAIAERQLVLHYQPKVRLADGTPTGVEALVRWPHPARGLVPPDEFIELAEHTGLIAGLTALVLEAAVAQLATWRHAGRELSVAVNLSPRDLLTAGLVEHVAALLRGHRVPAEALTLEVTETSLMGDLGRSVQVLQELSAMGVRLAIDDFGTGWSSLARLKQLPVDELKIDRDFVRDLDDPANLAIVTATVQLAQAFGLDLVAEGVEAEGAAALLARLGCSHAQGFRYARPLPALELEAWLDRVELDRAVASLRRPPRGGTVAG